MSQLFNIWKSIIKVIASVSTVHGLNNLIKGSRSRVISWLLLFIINFGFTAYLVVVVEERFDKRKIYTQMDSTPKVSEVPFPTVSICNENLLSSRELRNIDNILKRFVPNKQRRNKFYSLLPLLTQRTLNLDALTDDFEDILEILNQHYYDMDDIMLEVHQKCADLLTYCEFNRVQGKCSKMFKMIKTLTGYCCAFNYEGHSGRNSRKHSDDAVGKEGFISTSESGRYSGLKVIFNVEPEDYPGWSPAKYYGAKVLITDPNDFPEMTVHFRYIANGQNMGLKLSPLIYLSDLQLKSFKPTERNCWFDNEVMLGFTSRYSFETCCTECRVQQLRRRCGCIPFYYPINENYGRYCKLSDLLCLRNTTAFEDESRNKEMPYGCYCLPECSDKKYKVRSDILPFDPSNFPKQLKNSTLDNLSTLSVYYEKSTCTLYKRMLLMDWNDLIATYGGVFSFSIGASIITLLEFAFIIPRTIIRLIINKKYKREIIHGYKSN